jgi:hypothetical protein
MRAKQLEILRVNNISFDPSSLIYNLAFSPKIRFIDLSFNCTLNSADCIEAMHKLLKISGSIETLMLEGTSFITVIGSDFSKSLGQNKTIKNLILDSTTKSATTFTILGNGIAMNQYKSGVLNYVSVVNGFNLASATSSDAWFGSFLISDQDHEKWYGEKKVADDMEKDQLVKKWHFGLHNLDMEGCNFANISPIFKYKNFVKLPNPTWPKLIRFMKNTDITHLNLSNSDLFLNSFEILTVAIGSNPKACKNLKTLNLSNNKLDKEKAKLLAPALEENKTITFLDLSQNKLGVFGTYLIAKALENNTTITGLNLFKNSIDVDGSRAIGNLLKVSSSLEWLDVGHNRIRPKGLEAITNGIKEAKNSKLHTLGIRMNFINDFGFTTFFDSMVFSGKSSLEKVFINENNMTDSLAATLSVKVKASHPGIFVDRFEKVSMVEDSRLEYTLFFTAPTCN